MKDGCARFSEEARRAVVCTLIQCDSLASFIDVSSTLIVCSDFSTQISHTVMTSRTGKPFVPTSQGWSKIAEVFGAWDVCLVLHMA